MKPAPTLTAPAHAMLDRARRYCALAEQCESGVRQKLIAWGADVADVDAIVQRLRADDYLNDVRYARAYCESKIVGQHWGRQKVVYQLRAKRLPKEAIEAGMQAVDDEVYRNVLAEEADKKLRQLGGEATPEVNRKLAAFLVSRGFTSSEVGAVVDIWN